MGLCVRPDFQALDWARCEPMELVVCGNFFLPPLYLRIFFPSTLVSNFLCYIFDHPFQLFWKRSFTPPPLIFRYIKYFLVSINILKYFWQVFRYFFLQKNLTIITGTLTISCPICNAFLKIYNTCTKMYYWFPSHLIY
jgi:hypothetical protein